MKKNHFRLTCVAQKRLCLSSLFTASQDQIEISQHWKMVNYTQSAQFVKKPFEIFLPSGIEFFGLYFRQFQATQKFTESVLQGT